MRKKLSILSILLFLSVPGFSQISVGSNGSVSIGSSSGVTNPLNSVSLQDKGGVQGQVYNAVANGLKADEVIDRTCSITSGSAVVTCADGPFTSAAAAKAAIFDKAGVASADLKTTVSTYTSATQVTLGTTASTSQGPAVAGPPTITSVTDSSTGGTLLANTQYCYEVTAFGNSGETTPSAGSCVTTANDGLSTHETVISWGAASGATGYYVYGRTTGAEKSINSSSTTSYTDTGQISGNPYTPGALPPSFNTTSPAFVFGTDNSAPLNTLDQALYNAGGGAIYFNGHFLFLSKITLPNDDKWVSNQPTIAWVGPESWANAWAAATPPPFQPDLYAPAILDLRYVPSGVNDAKVETDGFGLFAIHHLTLSDAGSDCGAFVYSLYTTLKISDNLFSGTAPFANACNDGIYLGTGDNTLHFQGYGSYINHNHFRQIQTAVAARTAANGVQIEYNELDGTCGTSGTAPAISTSDIGDYIENNLIEVSHYPTGPALLSTGESNNFAFNQTWDTGGGCEYKVNVDDVVIIGESNVSPRQKVLCSNSAVPSPLVWSYIVNQTSLSGSVSGSVYIGQPDVSSANVRTVLTFTNYASTSKTYNLLAPYQAVATAEADCPAGTSVSTVGRWGTLTSSVLTIPDTTAGAVTGSCTINGK